MQKVVLRQSHRGNTGYKSVLAIILMNASSLAERFVKCKSGQTYGIDEKRRWAPLATAFLRQPLQGVPCL